MLYQCMQSFVIKIYDWAHSNTLNVTLLNFMGFLVCEMAIRDFCFLSPLLFLLLICKNSLLKVLNINAFLQISSTNWNFLTLINVYFNKKICIQIYQPFHKWLALWPVLWKKSLPTQRSEDNSYILFLKFQFYFWQFYVVVWGRDPFICFPSSPLPLSFTPSSILSFFPFPSLPPFFSCGCCAPIFLSSLIHLFIYWIIPLPTMQAPSKIRFPYEYISFWTVLFYLYFVHPCARTTFL